MTCTAQSTYLTEKYPSEHGIIANGWYFRDDCEVKFWRQSNKLVQAPKIWDMAREIDPSFTCANIFWWYNMYSTADIEVTPRPMYPADGRKLPDINSKPAGLRFQLQKELGQFPLFIALRVYVRMILKGCINTLSKRIKLVPSLPHLVL